MEKRIADEELSETIDILCQYEGHDKNAVLGAIMRLSEKQGISLEEALKKRFGVDVKARRKMKKMGSLKQAPKK